MTQKYSSTIGACVSLALRFRNNKNAAPYIITDGFGYHVVVRIGNHYYDKFGSRSLSDIIHDVEKTWKRHVVSRQLSWKELEDLCLTGDVTQSMRQRR